MAHITPYADVEDHTFENLIALCPTCHPRYDRGDIDRLSMKGYKANHAVVNGRYGDMERRVLDQLASSPGATHFRLPGGWNLQLWYLLKDGLIAKIEGTATVLINGPAHATSDPQSRTAPPPSRCRPIPRRRHRSDRGLPV
ncbi:HNH endonuclease [Streptomyces canus]|uniref:HNH endonuclease n=1 Tax=Streptomyces canus TaxID=58343 RepID=UPI0033B4D597